MVKKVDTKKIMTKKEYVEALAKLDLNQMSAARFLGFSPRKSRRIVSGEATIDLSVAKLLMVMIKHKLTVADVDKMVV